MSSGQHDGYLYHLREHVQPRREEKGVEDDRYSVDKLVEDVEWLGYNKIILKSDNGPAILALVT